MDNTRTYNVIDSLSVEHNGNQLKRVEDHSGQSLSYSGASDFVDGASLGTEYAYNANGALTMDKNRKISSITYDSYNNPRQVTFNSQDKTEYVYAPDGRKLRTKHSQSLTRPMGLAGVGGIGSDSGITLWSPIDSTEYLDNLIMENGLPSKYLFDGGYATLSSTGGVTGWHYFIQDYMGNVRMVVNERGTIEQETHYYPYGGVIGDLSTMQSLQRFKFEGKELDRKFGLDWYDIQARQYDAIGVPSWNKVDALADVTPNISPYVYCGGDPINRKDIDGNVVIFINGFEFRPNQLGTADYWPANFVNAILEHDTKMHKPLFQDGSCGGAYNIQNNTNEQFREMEGMKYGERMADRIIPYLTRDKNGKIIEPLIVATHSMGAAFAKGFLRYIGQYAKHNAELCEGLSLIEYDIAPFQPTKQSALDFVTTYQLVHTTDDIAKWYPIAGAICFDATEADGNPEDGHSISTFYESLKFLGEGNYEFRNGFFNYVGPINK